MMRKKIHIIGDSISLGYGLTSIKKSYTELLVKDNIFNITIFASCGNNLNTVFKNLSFIDKNADIWILFVGANGEVDRKTLSEVIRFLKLSNNRIIVCNVITDSENNDVIRSIDIDHQVVICDLNTRFKRENGYLQKDKIHPNNKGHKIIYDELIHIIKLWEN